MLGKISIRKSVKLSSAEEREEKLSLDGFQGRNFLRISWAIETSIDF